MEATNYSTDLTSDQWKIISKYIPVSTGRGRKSQDSMRDIINAILYLVHTGCQWRLIPHNFPAWYRVYYFFKKWKNDETWFLIHQALHQEVRKSYGKEAEPTGAIIDSQSVKTSALAETRGFNGGKQIKGRKRHLVVDTLGFPLLVRVHDANLNDGKQAIEMMKDLFFWFVAIKMIWADGGYRGEFPLWLLLTHQCHTEIALNLKGSGFQVLPKRWIVERTFGWLQWERRLNWDYERYPKSAETMVYLASIKIMLKRLN